MSELSTTGTIDRRKSPPAPGDAYDRPQWRTWLLVMLSLSVSFSAALYAVVVLVDPFSTGRFALTHRVDFATSNTRLANAGLVRDTQFDATIIGDSTAFALDPAGIAAASGWRIAQLAVPAGTPANLLTIARAFERHHRAVRTLEMFVLSRSWCRANGPNDNAYGSFPDWLYDSSDRVYLSRIFFPDAIEATVVRIAIWLGFANQAARQDGYAPIIPARDMALLRGKRPTDGPPADAPFPAIDALASHVAALPGNAAVLFVLPPAHISSLPVEGSAAAVRLAACKARIRQIAASRTHQAYLDLMTDNATTRSDDNFADTLHFTVEAARSIGTEIAQAIKDGGLSR